MIPEVTLDAAGPGVGEWLDRHPTASPPGESALCAFSGNRQADGGGVSFSLLCRIGDDYVNTAEAAQVAIEQLSKLPDAELFAEADLCIRVRAPRGR